MGAGQCSEMEQKWVGHLKDETQSRYIIIAPAFHWPKQGTRPPFGRREEKETNRLHQLMEGTEKSQYIKHKPRQSWRNRTHLLINLFYSQRHGMYWQEHWSIILLFSLENEEMPNETVHQICYAVPSSQETDYRVCSLADPRLLPLATVVPVNWINSEFTYHKFKK